jgi:hypothetical protein
VRAAAESPDRSGDRRIYTPADFARFSPKTAFDMVAQLPGFTIRGADQERGLGQASRISSSMASAAPNKSGGAVAELQKVSAMNVERIELSKRPAWHCWPVGPVANVIVKAARSRAAVRISSRFRRITLRRTCCVAAELYRKDWPVTIP